MEFSNTESSNKIVNKKLKNLRGFYIAQIVLISFFVLCALINRFTHTNMNNMIYLVFVFIIVTPIGFAILGLSISILVTGLSIRKYDQDKGIKIQWIVVAILLSLFGLMIFVEIATLSIKTKHQSYSYRLAREIITYLVLIGIIGFYVWSLVYVIKKLKKPMPPEEQETSVQ